MMWAINTLTPLDGNTLPDTSSFQQTREKAPWRFLYRADRAKTLSQLEEGVELEP